MKKFSILMVIVLLLGACGLTKEDLGMARSKPDETKVMKRNALVVPPDYEVRPQ